MAKKLDGLQLADIGERLYLVRRALDRQQIEIARDLSIRPSRWNNYERARRPLDIDVALNLRRLYGVSLDYLYDGFKASLPGELAKAIDRLEQPPRRRRTRESD